MIGKYTGPLNDLKREFKKYYNPRTAFTNKTIQKIQIEINKIEESMKGMDECMECKGWVEIECECCGHSDQCYECEGGLVEKDELKTNQN